MAELTRKGAEATCHRVDTSIETVVVTGAASGIGAAVARQLVREEKRVVGLDRDAAGLAIRSEELGASFAPIACDVADPADVEAALESEAPTGLVHAAGVLVLGDLLDVPLEELRRALAVHAEGLLTLVRAVTPAMVAAGGGAVVTVASNAATTPRYGMGAYGASKAASRMLTQVLGLELARHGIRCNTVSPGSTDTPMLRSMLGAEGAAPVIAGDPFRFRLGIPLGRVASPEDIASAVCFLLSREARHITLQDLKVDGGAT